MKGALVKRIALVAALAAALTAPRIASGQIFYQYPDAAVVKAGSFVAGPYGAVGDTEIFRFGGFGRMNVTKYFDVGLEFLVDSADGDGRWGAGGDLRFALFPETNAIPFDLSVTSGAGVIQSDAVEILQVPVGGAISSPFQLENGNILALYLGVYMLIIDTDIERGNLPNLSDTDLDVELRGGIRYSLTAGPDIFVGFHLGRDAMVTVGANLWIKRPNPSR
jgi:hypothetical protein